MKPGFMVLALQSRVPGWVQSQGVGERFMGSGKMMEERDLAEGNAVGR